MLEFLHEYIIKTYAYIVFFPAIVGLWYYKSFRAVEYKVFVILLWYAFINSIFKRYYGKYIDATQILTNIYNVVYFSFLFWLFYKKSINKKFKIILLSVVTLYVLSVIVEVFFIKMDYFRETQVFPYIIGGVGVIIFVFYYFFDILNSPKIVNVYKDLLFWICVAHFIYYLAFIPFKVAETDFINSEVLIPIRRVKIIGNIVKSVILIIGFIWIGKKDKRLL